MNRAGARAIAIGLVAAALAAGPAQAAEPTATEILAQNVAARGGLEAWRKIETMVWVGQIDSARAPVPDMRFVLEQKRPNKTRLEIHALGQGSMRVFDGTHGWKARPGRGQADIQPYSPQETRFAQAGHGFDGPLIDAALRGLPVALVSLDELGGRKAYHLKVHPVKGPEEDVWVDAQTHLDVRHDRVAEGPAGEKRRVTVTYGDYRAVEGLQIPFLIESGADSGTPDKMKLETVLLNPPLDDTVFANPGNPRRHDLARSGPHPSPATPPPSATAASAGPGMAGP